MLRLLILIFQRQIKMTNREKNILSWRNLFSKILNWRTGQLDVMKDILHVVNIWTDGGKMIMETGYFWDNKCLHHLGINS